jgi:uncharacterized tellurite resistance protein B-like protein
MTAYYDPTAVKARYGRTPKSEDQALNYARILKTIIAADGDIAAGEWTLLLRGLKRLGASAEAVADITAFEPGSVSLETLAAGLKPGGKRARLLLRDAIEISRGDGVYAQAEKAAVRKTAALLGVDDSSVRAIESLIEMEHAVKRLRKALL